MANFLDYFKAALIVQLFWSVSITLLVSTIPAQHLEYLTFASSSPASSAMSSIGGEMESALESETKIPVIDTGTLVFYSGNIILDLLSNFVLAIPQMFGLFLTGLFMLFPIDSTLQRIVFYFCFTVISVLYIFSMLAFITNLRSGGNLV